MSYWNDKDPNDYYIIVVAVLLLGMMIWVQYG